MSEKTEQATPKRLRDARKKGQVAKSKEVPSVIIILALIGTLFALDDFYLQHLQALMLLPIDVLNQPFSEALARVIPKLAYEIVILLAPLLATTLIAALVGNFSQIGLLFTFDPLMPKLEKIDPMKGLKRLFSLKNLMELGKSLLKVTVLALIVWWVIYDNMGLLLAMRYCDEQCLLPVLGLQIKQLMLYAAVGFVVVAAADFLFERYQFKKQLRMSKDEVKREHKESEGNPEIKGRRRQLHQEMQGSVRKNVKKSSVIVTNPTHLAIGILYQRGSTPLPRITVKGSATRARLIRRIAEQENIPIMQQVPLARALFADTDAGDYIPAELIQPVAEVLRWAERVNAQNSAEQGE